MSKAYRFTAIFFVLTLLSSCYRMPNDDEYSLVPLTNNRDITHEKDNGLAPSVSY